MTNAVLKLQDSGFSREQVEALTEFMSGSVATKEDVTDLRSEVKEDIARLEGMIEAQSERLEGKIEAQGQRLEGMIEAQGQRLEGMIEAQGQRLEGMIEAQGQRFNGKFTLLYWMLGLIIVVQVAPYLKMLFG